VAEKVTVTDITKPIDIATTSEMTISWEDWEKREKAHERLGKIKLGLSSNLNDPQPGQTGLFQIS